MSKFKLLESGEHLVLFKGNKDLYHTYDLNLSEYLGDLLSYVDVDIVEIDDLNAAQLKIITTEYPEILGDDDNE